MKTFLKHFSIGVVFQVVIVTISIFIGLGDLILLPYWIPLSLFDAIIDIPDNFGQKFGLIGFIFLFSIPGIFYSILFGLIMYVISRMKSQNLYTKYLSWCFPKINYLEVKMKIKKRYLFPVLFLILVFFAFIFRSEGLLMILITPFALPMLGIEIVLGTQIKDNVTLLILGEVILFFLLGYLWDSIAERFRNKKYSD